MKRGRKPKISPEMSEQLNSVSAINNQQIAAEKKQCYPKLIHFDQAGFDMSLSNFLHKVTPVINNLKNIYNVLGLYEPFDDETFALLLSSNPKIVHQRYAEKLKTLSDVLGIPEGVTFGPGKPSNHTEALSRINPIIEAWDMSISLYYNRHPQSNLKASDVIDINGTPKLKQEAYEAHRAKYECYINNEHEESILQTLNKFEADYNSFVDFLVSIGYGPYVGPILQHSYLGNLYDETAGYKLQTLHSATPFLMKFLPFKANVDHNRIQRIQSAINFFEKKQEKNIPIG